MRILYLHQYFNLPTDNGGTRSYEMARSLVTAGHEVHMITSDPLSPEQIAEAIQYLKEHPEEAKQMGENGRKAVVERYNWEPESKQLLELYEEVLIQ